MGILTQLSSGTIFNSPNSACTMGFWRVKGWWMYPRLPRLPDISGHGKSSKNDEFINIFKKNGAGAGVLVSTISFFVECFSQFDCFCCKMPWGLLRPLGACLGLRGTLLGLPWDPLGSMDLIHASDPWIWSMDQIHGSDRIIDFLTSFWDFQKLSFVFAPPGITFALFLFYLFAFHFETFRSSRLSSCLRG